MAKPLLLVDVDGVLNALGPWLKYGDDPNDAPHSFANDGVWEADGGSGLSFTITLPRGVKKRLAYLATVFETVWCTTWGVTARGEIAPGLGIGQDWDVIDLDLKRSMLPSGQLARTWKLPTVWEWCAKNAVGRDVAWIDDDLQGDTMWWIADRTEKDHGRTLPLLIDPETGLTAKNVRSLRTWACA